MRNGGRLFERLRIETGGPWLLKCLECGAEMQSEAKFCQACGTQVGLKKDVFQVSTEKLVEKFREMARDARVKRVSIKDDKGKVLLSIPAT